MVGFEPDAYNVSESVGSINLSVSFISGNYGEEFVPHVNASTIDGTATGSKYLINLYHGT